MADARLEQVDNITIFTINPKLACYGVDVTDLQTWLHSEIGGNQAGLIFEGDRRFSLAVRFSEDMRSDLDVFGDIPIVTADGEYLPLAEVAELKFSSVPSKVRRNNGKRCVVVTANLRQRNLGIFEQIQSASQLFSIAVPATLLIILTLLVIAFSSIKDALIVFIVVPLALTGGIFALWMRGLPLSISARVEFITLSGIAVLNGLVMLSFIKQRLLETGELVNSIVEGPLTRLRPVLMTAHVASLGFVPMAINS